MKAQLNIEIDQRILDFLEAEAVQRQTTPEKLGEFAVELLTHFSAQIRDASAVILEAPEPEEAPRYMLYATSVPEHYVISVQGREDSAGPQPETFALYVRGADDRPRLRAVKNDLD